MARLDGAGRPIIENFRGSQPVEAEETVCRYREAIESLPRRVAHFALLATIPGEIETIAPEHAGWRVREFALCKSGAVAAWCAPSWGSDHRYRDIQRLWRGSVGQEGVSC